MRSEGSNVGRSKGGSEQETVNVRLARTMLARLEALRPTLERDPEYAPLGTLNRSDLIRLALNAGVVALERKIARSAPDGTP